MSNDKRAVILVSGGMDSATAVYESMERGYEPYFLHTSYGKNTENKEYECAKALAEEVGAAEFLRIETGHLAAIGASSLTDEEMDVEDADLDSILVCNNSFQVRLYFAKVRMRATDKEIHKFAGNPSNRYGEFSYYCL